MFAYAAAIIAGASLAALATGRTAPAAVFGIAAALSALAHYAHRRRLDRMPAEQELRDAQTALDNLDCGHDYECPEYLAANARVIDAEQAVAWWRRPFVRLDQ